MRTFAEKQNQFQKLAPSNRVWSHTATPRLHPRVDLYLYLHRTIGNKAVLRMAPIHAAIHR